MLYRRPYGSFAAYAAHKNASEEETIALCVALSGLGVSARIRLREQLEAEDINFALDDGPELDLIF